MKFWSFSNFTLWISEFQLWPKIPLKLVIFPLWTKGFRLKKVFSNLELERQGHGIIMGVTCILLLGPFYTIQTKFMYFFAHDGITTTTTISWNHRIIQIWQFHKVFGPIVVCMTWCLRFVYTVCSVFVGIVRVCNVAWHAISSVYFFLW